jgi:hypothetical protein
MEIPEKNGRCEWLWMGQLSINQGSSSTFHDTGGFICSILLYHNFCWWNPKKPPSRGQTTHAQWVCRCDVRWNQPIISRRILIMFFKGLKPRVYEGI